MPPGGVDAGAIGAGMTDAGTTDADPRRASSPEELLGKYMTEPFEGATTPPAGGASCRLRRLNVHELTACQQPDPRVYSTKGPNAASRRQSNAYRTPARAGFLPSPGRAAPGKRPRGLVVLVRQRHTRRTRALPFRLRAVGYARRSASAATRRGNMSTATGGSTLREWSRPSPMSPCQQASRVTGGAGRERQAKRRSPPSLLAPSASSGARPLPARRASDSSMLRGASGLTGARCQSPWWTRIERRKAPAASRVIGSSADVSSRRSR